MHTCSTGKEKPIALFSKTFLLICSFFATSAHAQIHTAPDGWKELHNSECIRLDIRYATAHNFTKKKIYPCGRCFLKEEAVTALNQVARQLEQQGYGLLLFDCYRPLPAQWKLWEIVSDPRYVADPRKGSMHNRGIAVDLTLYDLHTGKAIDMGTPYDFFGPQAHSNCTDLPEQVLQHRKILAQAMKSAGFEGIATEWWHFSLRQVQAPLAQWEWICP